MAKCMYDFDIPMSVYTLNWKGLCIELFACLEQMKI